MIRYLTVILFISFSISCGEKSSTEIKPEIIPVQKESPDRPTSLYVFTKTNGWRHDNIDLGRGILYKMAQEQGWEMSFTEDSLLIRKERLANVDVLVFFNTTLDVLGPKQEQAVESFIKRGGGFLGIHAAADTEHDWPFYHDLVGAYYNNHTDGIVKATSRRILDDHPINEGLPQDWERTDEWYNFKSFKDHIIPLYNLDETSYEGGENGEYHPIAWYHEKFKGRAVYTGMGHTKENWSEPDFLQFIVNAVNWITRKDL